MIESIKDKIVNKVFIEYGKEIFVDNNFKKVIILIWICKSMSLFKVKDILGKVKMIKV